MEPKTADRRELLKAALLRIQELERRLASATQHHVPIAIVGLGCRFPGGADDPESFWKLLQQGTDAITAIPAARWQVDEHYDADPAAPGKMYVREGGFIGGVDLFDPQFFGIAPREAAQIDPQQRLLLETTWVALEHAGIPPNSLAGSRTGVFVGMTTHDYASMQAALGGLAAIDTYFGAGIASSIASGRLAYVLGLRGPAVTVDTACSSSLVAVHLACQSLRNDETRLGIAGGVNLILWPDGYVIGSKGRMLAPDGRCKTFDARADGYVRSEGCGVVVLKRLPDAIADGDSILAIIRGTAINQDGRSGGLTAPNGRAQEDVMREALAAAGLTPRDVAYVEAHGTGTSLGDPIEVLALGAVQGRDRPKDAPLLIGSVKTNIGHLEAAAGIAGLIKAVLSMENGAIPPHLHFQTPSPHIPWQDLPLRVPTALTPFPTGRRVCGVSSFGFSGTNAHLVVEAGPEPATPQASLRPAEVLVVSARTGPALQEAIRRMLGALARCTPADFADFCYTAAAARSHFEHRVAVVGASPEEMISALQAFLAGAPSGVVTGEVASNRLADVAFLFTGQGSQYVNMARRLYGSLGVFTAALDRCDRILSGILGESLLAILFPPPDREEESGARLGQTAWTQPALFAVEYALAEVWQSWGVRPSVLVGHSVGEYVAACVAGVFSLDEGLALVAERGRLMEALPGDGAMVAVNVSEAVVADVINRLAVPVAIAAVNAPSQTVISGPAAAVAVVVAELADAGRYKRPLRVSHAFHSPSMEPMLDDFERAARRVEYRPARIPIVSNVTGAVIEAPGTLDARYWRSHTCATVRFADSAATVRRMGCTVCLEVGPQPSLIALLNRSAHGGGMRGIPSLRRDRDDWMQMLSGLASLWVSGVAIDWSAYNREVPRRKLRLPTYPFQRERYWTTVRSTPAALESGRTTVHRLLGVRLTSPSLTGVVFERSISTGTAGSLSGHRIFDRVVVPAAAYLEMALAAGRLALNARALAIRNFTIREPLVVGDELRVLQTILTPGEPAGIQIVSREAAAADDAAWTLHAAGQLVFDTPDYGTPVFDAGAGDHFDATDYYATLLDRGVQYGDAYRGLTSIRRGERRATAVVEMSPAVRAECADYLVHPAILDACFQLLGVVLPQVDDDTIYLPVEVGTYRTGVNPDERMHCDAAVESVSGRDMFVGRVTLTTHDGRMVADVDGLRFRRATRAVLARAMSRRANEWLYELQWRPLPALVPRMPLGGQWILVGDESAVMTGVGAELERRGGLVSHVLPEALAGHVDHVVSTGAGIGGIVFLPGPDVPMGADGGVESEDFERRLVDGPADLASIVGVMTLPGIPRAPLTIVTHGAQPPGTASDVSAMQAAVCGLGRVAATEHPDLQIKLVDADDISDAAACARLADEITDIERLDDQVVLENGQRTSPSLTPLRDSGRHIGALTAPASPLWALTIADRGVIDNLRLTPLAAVKPGPREIRIRVQASGLNFRDVLNALGMYPGNPGDLGGEVVGVVEAVGNAVTRFREGDPVMALTPRAFCSVVNTAELLACHRPEWLSVQAAATIPMAFQTAHYALNHIGRMRPGDRVLIHAGAGGVGLAAVQLARLAGAEVFATAGTEAKRSLLRKLGVRHVMDSRSLAFADEVISATGGEGIDIALNALTGDFVPATLRLLRTGGRFLELGKTDVWDEVRARSINPEASYSVVFLGDACVSTPELIAQMFGELMERFTSRELTPLPSRVWPIDRAPEAFRYMAQARHIGKVVIEHGLEGDEVSVRHDGTYLVTGGFGGLGLEVARWLADRGAGRLVLVGRRGPSAAAAAVVKAIQTAGTRVDTVAADVTDATAMDALLASIDAGDVPLRGVVHAAGVVNDHPIAQMTREHLATVMRPKAVAAAYLDARTRDRALDFFVLFSAGAGLFGSAGQGNYAAANAFLDALAWQRRLAGLPAISLDWGPWSDVGMAAAVSPTVRQRWAAMGLHSMTPAQGIAALEAALRANRPQVAVFNMNWEMWRRHVGGQRLPTLFRELTAPPGLTVLAGDTVTAVNGQPGDLRGWLAVAKPEDRESMLREELRMEIGRVLALDAAIVLNPDRGLVELGMDSLMAVDLSNRLAARLGRTLAPTLAFEHPTLSDLARHLLRVLDLKPEAPGPALAGRDQIEL